MKTTANQTHAGLSEQTSAPKASEPTPNTTLEPYAVLLGRYISQGRPAPWWLDQDIHRMVSDENSAETLLDPDEWLSKMAAKPQEVENQGLLVRLELDAEQLYFDGDFEARRQALYCSLQQVVSCLKSVAQDRITPQAEEDAKALMTTRNYRLRQRIAKALREELVDLLDWWDRLHGAKPQPAPSQPAGTFEALNELDNLFRNVSAAIGIHPVDLATIRYGETASHTTANSLRQGILDSIGNPTAQEFGQALAESGIISAAAGNWLDRGPGILDFERFWGGPLEHSEGKVARMQFFGLDPWYSRNWLHEESEANRVKGQFFGETEGGPDDRKQKAKSRVHVAQEAVAQGKKRARVKRQPEAKS